MSFLHSVRGLLTNFPEIDLASALVEGFAVKEANPNFPTNSGRAVQLGSV